MFVSIPPILPTETTLPPAVHTYIIQLVHKLATAVWKNLTAKFSALISVNEQNILNQDTHLLKFY